MPERLKNRYRFVRPLCSPPKLQERYSQASQSASHHSLLPYLRPRPLRGRPDLGECSPASSHHGSHCGNVGEQVLVGCPTVSRALLELCSCPLFASTSRRQLRVPLCSTHPQTPGCSNRRPE